MRSGAVAPDAPGRQSLKRDRTGNIETTATEGSSTGALPATIRTRAVAAGAVAVGAFALGAVAVGALAVGALAVGRLAIGSAKVKRLRIEELEVGRLRVEETVGE